jgi:hypothetical protein
MPINDSFSEDQPRETGVESAFNTAILCLVGNIDAPYLVFASKESSEAILENYSNYLGFEGSILGEVTISDEQISLFEFIISTNYGQSTSSNFLYNHTSLWDLFRIPLTDIQRCYLSSRFKNFHETFEHDFTDQVATFPDFETPYWFNDQLFPILFRQVREPQTEEELS